MLDRWLVICSNSANYTKQEIVDKLKRYLKKDTSSSASSTQDKPESGIGEGLLLQANYLLQRIQFINVLWVLDSVTNYCIQPISSYPVADSL